MLVSDEDHCARDADVCENRCVVASTTRRENAFPTLITGLSNENVRPGTMHGGGGGIDPLVELESNLARRLD